MKLKNTLGLAMAALAVRFLDEAPVTMQDKLHMPTKRKFKMSGQMIAPCTIARTGIMEYRAKDLGEQFKDHAPDDIIKVMTLAEDLFDEASIDSYRAAPFTIGHPEKDVDTENAKDLMKGMLEGTPCKDEAGEELVGTMVLSDADAIALVRANINQLSSGHNAVLVLCDFDSVGYHAKKTNIRANHIAIVPKGRAGTAAIADSADVEEEVINDVPVVAPVIEVAKVADAGGEVKVADAALIAEVETLKAKLDDLTTKLADAVAVGEKLKDIDALVEERMAFVSQALSLADVDVKGLTKMEVMRAVVAKVCPTAPVSMSDQYVEVRYGILLEDKDKDDSTDMTQALRDSIGVTNKPVVTQAANETARENMIKRYEGAK